MIFRYDNSDDLEMFLTSRINGKNNVVLTTGYFDPIHAGHISYFKEISQTLLTDDDVFIVAVNGDKQAKIKKGKSFMPVEDRALIIDSFEFVDHVFIYDNDKVKDSVEVIDIIRPKIFAKGFNPEKEVPEQAICDLFGIKIVRQLGDVKTRSSSNYLEEWVNFINKKK